MKIISSCLYAKLNKQNSYWNWFFLFLLSFISQVEKNIPGACILACAPSNSAADQLCERLITSQHVDAQKIYRVYASSRNPKAIPKVLEVSACLILFFN